MNIAPVFLWTALLAGLVAVGIDVASHRSPAFPVLVLTSYIAMFSFISGFSIGLLLSMSNIFLALIGFSLFKECRSEFAFVAVVSSLLVLFMGGHWPPARMLLEILLAIALVYCLYEFRRSRGKRHVKEHARIGLEIAALLLFLGMLVSFLPFNILLGLMAAAVSLLLLFNLNVYKWHSVVLAAISVAWVLMVVRQVYSGS